MCHLTPPLTRSRLHVGCACINAGYFCKLVNVSEDMGYFKSLPSGMRNTEMGLEIVTLGTNEAGLSTYI